MLDKSLKIKSTRLEPRPSSIVERLRYLAKVQPTKAALTVVSEHQGKLVELTLTYAQLDSRSRTLAAKLQQSCEVGERVLIMLDNNEHYVVSFFACLYAGVIAVPLFVPESARSQHLQRVIGIGLDCEAKCILAQSQDQELLQLTVQGITRSSGNTCELIFVDKVSLDHELAWSAYEPSPQDLAFLQYTSGSTAAPKGVMVSHANLIANELAMSEGITVRADEVVVSWLPLYHDMGLMAGLLLPLFNGSKCVLMSPRFFLEKPIRWLQAIARHRATVSGGPDFSYRLCVERIKSNAIAELDLSSWQVAFSGAEPVRVDTLHAFIAHTKAASFNPHAVYPCYGLAEGTLFVTGPKRMTGLSVATFSAESFSSGLANDAVYGVQQVACGSTVSAHKVRITEMESKAELEHGQVGEIWLTGPSVAQGYWCNPKATAETFLEHQGQRWLRTGDLGIYKAGQLYIVGRSKDVIISNGRNVYPQDIEKVIEEQFEFARKGRVSAFSRLDRQSDGIGIALEIARNIQRRVSPQLIVDRLKEIVAQSCGETVTDIMLLQPASLPKTSSGKLQRNACRSMLEKAVNDLVSSNTTELESAFAIFSRGTLLLGQHLVAKLAPAPFSAHEQQLADIWAEVLCIPADFNRDAHFLVLGGDSLKTVQLLHRIQSQWSVSFTAHDIFHLPRFAEQAAAILQRQAQPIITPEEQLITKQNFVAGQQVAMSYAQARQWFLWQLKPTSSAYNVGVRLNLHTAIEPQRMQHALNELVIRHAALRTQFATDEIGNPVQCVSRGGNWPLQLIDLSHATTAEREAQLKVQAAKFSQQPFDLRTGPLVRAALINLAEKGYQLILVMHHIICDGVSMQIVLEQLAQIYLSKVSPCLDEDTISYQDYAIWQRAQLMAGKGQQQLQWWQAKLAAEQPQPILQLMSDFSDVTKATATGSSRNDELTDNLTQGATHSVTLPQRLVHKLRNQAGKQNASLFMVMLASFHALMYRHTGQEDVRVGIPIANRHLPQLSKLVGFLVNTQVIPSQFNGEITLHNLVAQIKEVTLAAQEHKDVPFELLVETIQPTRNVDSHPLFQVMFSHTRHDISSWHELLQDRVVDNTAPWQTLQVAPQFELTLEMYELQDDQLTLEFVYPRARFLPATIARMAEHYLALLYAYIETPMQRLAQVNLQSQDERTQLVDWGQGLGCQKMPIAIHQLFEKQVFRTPAATALISAEQEVSYQALNQQANALAHFLLAQNIQPEDRIGIAFEPGVAMLVTLLAIYKAGAAYVPLDPAYPKERLLHMVNDSGVKLILTSGHLLSYIALVSDSPHVTATVLAFEHLPLQKYSQENPNIVIHDAHLAYVIYTSGSTGLPKGVCVEHGPLAMHIQTIAEVYGVDETHRELQFFSINFDAAAEQWMAPLIAGGSLVLAKKQQLDVDSVAVLIKKHGINALHLPPAYLRLLTPLLSGYSQIRTCIVGGEELTRSDFLDAYRAFSAPRIINAYGPTETIITPTAWVNEAGNDIASIPIGRPVGPRQVYVLDADLNLAPQGACGELFISGAAIARCYLGRAGLTAERFIANPFTSSGATMYRTGDLVRWDQNGQLHYLGRIDQQVKIRGFRIELGEIEAQLMALEDLKEAVVLAKEVNGSTQLVAYVGSTVGDDGRLACSNQLRHILSQRLPDYMVPSAIVVLPQLPVTANGKIDRQSLPEPQWGSGEQFQAPKGSLAITIAAIWSKVLGVDKVGVHDNFFDLGGHSLLLGQMQLQLEAAFQHKLSMLDMFHMTTVSMMADYFTKLIEHVEGNPQSTSNLNMKKASAHGKRQRQAFLKKTRPAEEN
ncbi:non-ribosomal peptide synthetase [Pseudoalteromonas prydzensis]|uniref:Amino acid adenylation domain-containing protein n=1 Tax=Pseudoalteromonas prydzensis TaxID=182141 RepID=A0ABR9FJP4_9GAMM|nr:non-ribosomal peptide synthetase [Pseudoalteromonas prydzensis]MBE0457050.1 amino acid adenylation domain-containing protein [Pseudoalteromonas prydzensis]